MPIETETPDTLIEVEFSRTYSVLWLERAHRLLVLVVLLLVAQPLILPAAKASVMNIRVTNDNLTLDYRLEVQTNLTRTMPLVTVQVGPSNSSRDVSAVLGPIESAMQKQVPQLRLDSSNFRFSARTEILNAASRTWRIQENITATVTGARSSPGQLVNYEMGFLSINVSDSIRLANVELNQIGKTYLLPSLQSQTADAYFLSHTQYSTSFVPLIVTERFNLLDFTWIPQVSQWYNSPEALGHESTWTFDPSTMGRTGAPYNLTLATHPVENTYLNFTVARYIPTVELTAPPRARAGGSIVSFEVSGPADIVMPLIVMASLGVGLVSYFAERKALRPRTSRNRRAR